VAELPLVLAGPVLRRVDAQRVSVWVALSKPGSVTLKVFRGRATSTGNGTADLPEVGSQMRETRRCGAQLHVVVVDAEVAGMPARTRHSYDVVVTADGETKGLRELGMLRDGSADPSPAPRSLMLGHGTDKLPSFVTPAADVPGMRLVHASCRKSNGPGPDALAWLDDRIQEGLSDVAKAPQQLFLTGDQIYADDVGAVLLPMLTALGRELVGPEKLPVGAERLDATIERFPALRRQDCVRALGSFTTTDGANHLLTYGEFVAMYCVAFSPAAWGVLAKPDDLFLDVPADQAKTKVTLWEEKFGTREKWKTEKNKAGRNALMGVTDEAARVEAWRDAVPKVARVLANVPTYMIFDDHEVTDDWNISPRWRKRVTNSDFGRAVLRHALLAYTVFQAWGNDPQTFRHDVVGGQEPAESELHANEKLVRALSELAGSIADPSVTLLDRIDDLLGLASSTAVPKAVFNYEVPGPKHTVRVLDTRTRRTYAGSGHAPPKLLGVSLDQQLPKGPFTDDRDLLVVVSPVPVLFPRIFESVGQPGAALAFDLSTHISGQEKAEPGKVTGLLGSEHKDIEGWRADEVHHEQLLRRLGTYRRVVVLSGDIHFANTLCLDYWGKDDAVLDSRVVQCTASAARNQPGENMRGLLRTLRIGQQLLRGLPCERIGWDTEHGVVLPPGASIRPGRRGRLLRKPVILPAGGWPAGTTVTKTPDWRWRVDVLRDDRPRTALPAGAPDVPVLTWVSPPDADKLSAYADIAAEHARLAAAPKDPLRLMVFRNNIGLVSFAVDGSDFRVSHTLLSTADDETGDAFTEHTVPFAPDPAPVAPELGTG
jgi:hypothetical protein